MSPVLSGGHSLLPLGTSPLSRPFLAPCSEVTEAHTASRVKAVLFPWMPADQGWDGRRPPCSLFASLTSFLLVRLLLHLSSVSAELRVLPLFFDGFLCLTVSIAGSSHLAALS